MCSGSALAGGMSDPPTPPAPPAGGAEESSIGVGAVSASTARLMIAMSAAGVGHGLKDRRSGTARRGGFAPSAVGRAPGRALRSAGMPRPWPTTPPTAAQRAAYADAEPRVVLARRPRREPGRRRRWPASTTPTCASSAAASPGCGRRCTPRPTTRRATSSCSRPRRVGFGRQRPQRRVLRRLAHPRDRATGWRASPTRCATLERLGLENFAGLRGRPRRATASTATSRRPASCSRCRTPTRSPWLARTRELLRASATTSRCSTSAAMRAEVALAHLPRRRLGPHRRRRPRPRQARRAACATRRCGPACASTSTRPCTTCARPAAASTVLDRAGARCAPAASCSPRAPTRRCCARSATTSCRSTTTCWSPSRSARRSATRSAGRERQGIGDGGNQFHYYRLTADDRILFGGYDAVYRFGGPVGAAPRRARRRPSRRSPSTSSTRSRSSRACASPTAGAARSTPARASRVFFGTALRRARRLRDRLHRPRRRRRRASAPASRSTCSTAATPRPPACATCAASRSRSRPSRCAAAVIQLHAQPPRRRRPQRRPPRPLAAARSTASASASTAETPGQPPVGGVVLGFMIARTPTAASPTPTSATRLVIVPASPHAALFSHSA